MDWSKYAPYFTRDEFRCKVTGRCDMRVEFMDKLYAIRQEWGKPMVINSGYRDPTHPIESVKPMPGEHSYGVCADVMCGSVASYELMAIAVKHGITRIGVKQRPNGDRFLHLGIGFGDIFPIPALWSYP